MLPSPPCSLLFVTVEEEGFGRGLGGWICATDCCMPTLLATVAFVGRGCSSSVAIGGRGEMGFEAAAMDVRRHRSVYLAGCSPWRLLVSPSLWEKPPPLVIGAARRLR
ncbi:hypothetical protein ACLOJK_037949 [Asimina triloba]